MIRFRHALPRLALLLGFALAAAGCGERPLATVGTQTITVGDFESAARQNPGRYPGPPDSARRLLLDDLVTRALLVEEAKQRGLDRDSLAQQARKLLEDQAIASELIERMAPREVAVSEAEIDSFHQRNGIEAHALVVFVADEPAAKQARALLDQGTSFAEVADRFNEPGTVPPGGDVGFQRVGGMVEPLDDVLATAKIGETVGPVDASGEGWFIVRVLERRTRPIDSLTAENRRMAREMMRQRKQRLLAARAGRQLLEQYRVRLEPGGAQALFQRYNVPPDPQLGLVSPPPPTPEQAATVLARWDDGRGGDSTFTLGQAVADLIAGAERPDFMRVPAIERWIRNRVLQRVVPLEGRRRHLHDEPEVKRRARERFHNYLAEQVYNAEILNVGEVDSAGIAAAYERHRDQMERLGSARLLWAAFPDSATAAAAIGHAGHAGTLREAVAMAAPGMQAREERLRFPTGDRVWDFLARELTAMAPNEYRGPLMTPRGWMVMQLLEKEQTLVPLDQLPPGALQALRTEAIELARETRLKAFVAGLRAKIPVKLFEDRLAKVKWPVEDESSGQGPPA